MKKIAETFIGATHQSYVKYGSTSLLVARTGNFYHDNERKWHKDGSYNAYCRICDSIFSFGNGYTLHRQETVYCPGCGKKHQKHEIMYSNDCESDLGYNIRLAIIEFKNKIELRINYIGVNLGKNVFNDGSFDYKVMEKYTFDILNNISKWEKYKNDVSVDNTQLGSFSDMEKMKNRTILYFLNYKQKINRGNSFKELLGILRKAFVKKVQEVKKWVDVKSTYINGTNDFKILGNVLNVAYRTRFIDSQNLKFCWAQYQNWCRYFINNANLPQQIEDIIDKKMREDGFQYIQAAAAILKIPNTKNNRKLLMNMETWLPLVLAYKTPTANIAQTIFPHFYRINRNSFYNKQFYQDKGDIQMIIDFLNGFWNKYKNTIQIQTILTDTKHQIKDIVCMWKMADKITKENFEKENVKFRNLHDWLAVSITKQNNREVIFNLNNKTIKRYDKKIDGFQCEAIKKYSQLKYVASTLKNCAAGYKNRINDKSCLVVITQDNKKPVALLEIVKGEIKQAKLFDNKPVKTNQLINSLVQKFVKISKTKIDTRDILINNADEHKNIIVA